MTEMVIIQRKNSWVSSRSRLLGTGVIQGVFLSLLTLHLDG